MKKNEQLAQRLGDILTALNSGKHFLYLNVDDPQTH